MALGGYPSEDASSSSARLAFSSCNAQAAAAPQSCPKRTLSHPASPAFFVAKQQQQTTKTATGSSAIPSARGRGPGARRTVPPFSGTRSADVHAVSHAWRSARSGQRHRVARAGGWAAPPEVWARAGAWARGAAGSPGGPVGRRRGGWGRRRRGLGGRWVGGGGRARRRFEVAHRPVQKEKQSRFRKQKKQKCVTGRSRISLRAG